MKFDEGHIENSFSVKCERQKGVVGPDREREREISYRVSPRFGNDAVYIRVGPHSNIPPPKWIEKRRTHFRVG